MQNYKNFSIIYTPYVHLKCNSFVLGVRLVQLTFLHLDDMLTEKPKALASSVPNCCSGVGNSEWLEKFPKLN